MHCICESEKVMLHLHANLSPGIQCRGGWGFWCWLLARLAPAEFVWGQLPAVLDHDSVVEMKKS